MRLCGLAPEEEAGHFSGKNPRITQVQTQQVEMVAEEISGSQGFIRQASSLALPRYVVRTIFKHFFPGQHPKGSSLKR